MKKITLVSFLYKPHVGGIENSIYELSKVYRQLGFDVQVCCTTEPKQLHLQTQEEFHGTLIKRYKWKHSRILFFPFSLVYNLIVLSFWFTKEAKHTIVISRHHIMAAALRLAGIDYVYLIPEVVLKNSSTREKMTLKGKVTMWVNAYLQKIAVEGANKTYAFSKNVKAQLVKADINKEIFLVKPGINTEKFNISKDEARRRLGFRRDAIILLGVGRLIESKGFHYMIEALKRVDIENVTLILVGEGTFQNRLELLVKDLDLSDKVVFAGKSTVPEVFFCACDIFLMTSINEAFGQTVLEAAVAERPIIAFESGIFGDTQVETATAEILGQQYGLLYCHPNTQDLSRTIVKCIDRFQGSDFKVKYSNVHDYSWKALAEGLLQ